jgi:hypothetical protein
MVLMIPVHFQNRGNIRTDKPFEISSYRMEEGGVVDFLLLVALWKCLS